ncbi:MAG: hypothetical protein HUU35_04420 [Armatimonadetes bacterium]|nr:hypothetical protein [Armatimonadota bacterium]
MPMGRLMRAPAPDRALLLQQMVEEWEHPGIVPGGPVIIVDQIPQPPHSTRIFVIWDAWASLDIEERSALIMEAYAEVVADQAELIRVSIAWGLTSHEAKERGLSYEQIG